MRATRVPAKARVHRYQALFLSIKGSSAFGRLRIDLFVGRNRQCANKQLMSFPSDNALLSTELPRRTRSRGTWLRVRNNLAGIGYSAYARRQLLRGGSWPWAGVTDGQK